MKISILNCGHYRKHKPKQQLMTNKEGKVWCKKCEKYTKINEEVNW